MIIKIEYIDENIAREYEFIGDAFRYSLTNDTPFIKLWDHKRVIYIQTERIREITLQ